MIDFSIPVKEQPLIMGQIMGRCGSILDNEGIKYDKSVLAQFIQKTFPDFRKILNELQSYSAMGKIDEGILELTTTRYDYLVDAILNKDFKSCEKWTNGNTYDASIYSLITKAMREKVDGLKWMEIVLEADERQYRHSFAVDPDITLWAFCIVVMGII
jgi:DNA polymerase III delta prime subunit